VSSGEEIGRSRKVSALTSMIDSELLAHDLGPFDARVLSKLIERLPSMQAHDWTRLVVRHGRPKLKPPSDKTLAVLLEFFRARLAEVESERRLPVPHVA